jgi:hypothetical protein
MAAVDPSDTFVDKLKRTAYRVFLNIHLKYDVYVYRGGFSRDFHDQVVLRAKEYNNLGFVTMELGKNESSQIVAKSIMFQGDKSKLEHKGTIEGCLEDFAVLAMDILISMGRYALVGNNCQNFCNKFLEKVGLEDGQYITTVAVLFGVLVAIAAGLFGVWQFKRSSNSKKK